MFSWIKKKADADATRCDEVPRNGDIGRSHQAGLLKRAIVQWRFGDWAGLSALDTGALWEGTDKLQLALLAIAGQFQEGDFARARELIAAAQASGSSSRPIARILVSGVHNSLGNARALLGDQERALTHFWSSLRIGDPGCELRLLAPARASHQAFLYGLPQKGLWRPLLQKWGKGQVPARHKRDETSRVATASHIVIAGMRHSGSTALFNIVRLALEQAGIDFVSGYSEHESFKQAAESEGKLRLIKTHEFRDDVSESGGLILTTRRDLRDSVASAVRRRFPMVNKLGGATEYAKYNRTLHDVWQPHSDFEFVYEAYMAEPTTVVKDVLAFLGMDLGMAAAIQEQVLQLPVDKYEETLLSPTHITDPERKHSFWDTLPLEVIQRINDEHGRWLERYGYQV